MRTSALFILAALVFSISVGAIEALWARRERRQRKENATVLHPSARYRFGSVQYPPSSRAFYHVALFFGFLLVSYVGLLVLKTVYSFVAQWF